MQRTEPIDTIDWHTGGEPFRIVPSSPAAVTGDGLTVAQRRVIAMNSDEVQWMRALLCSEPRGHADMYGGFLVPPDDAGAHLGVLFWHKDGFSTACGHGTMALGAWAVASGRVPAPADGVTDVVVDVPSGRVTASVRTSEGLVEEVTFTNVASHVHATDIPVETSRGPVTVDIAFGGAMYAVLPAAAIGLKVRPQDVSQLIAVGREIRDALNTAGVAEHPSDPQLSGVYGTIFAEEVGPPRVHADGSRQLHQRNLTVFADGEVDRSPCGSGTSARVALLAATGDLRPGDELHHESVVGSVFRARIKERATSHGQPAVIASMTGTAHMVAECRFTVDPRDDLVPGFVLR
ncbi:MULTISPECIES: proline racemase family protein [Streptomyces]|uniref:Proline racemase n=1 Tax=Streptomyces lasalocidi TaxID=324833 RepID=A0A4U5W7T1_STRLS|nr:proline racemase family protein [Streptomyces lasalocidi]TKS96195.1 proline racemase [Streptomyces lasalocidi]